MSNSPLIISTSLASTVKNVNPSLSSSHSSIGSGTTGLGIGFTLKSNVIVE
jgi:hypothetical protein